MDRNLGLDLIRVLAISLVFYSHLISGVVKGIPIGNFGVELFFILSGFLVGRHFFIHQPKYTLNFFSKFIIKRWLRTIPLYYFVITLKILLTKHTFYDAFKFYLFIQNYTSPISFFSVSWSLSVEEWFYLLLPIIAVLFFKASRYINQILITITVLYFFELVLRFYKVLKYDSSWEIISSTIHLRMDSLLTGFLLVFIKYQHPSIYHKLKSFWVFCFGVILVFIYLMFFSFYYQENQINSLLFFRTGGFVLLSFFIALLVPYIENISFKQKTNSKHFFTVFITLFSTLTYSFYLIHSEVIEFVNDFHINFMVRVMISFALSLFFSWLLYLAIEKPFLKLKDKIKIH